jgi:hypothetical protein
VNVLVRAAQREETGVRDGEELMPSPPKLAITMLAKLALFAAQETSPVFDKNAGEVRVNI